MFGDKKDKKVVLTKPQAIIALIEGNTLRHRLPGTEAIQLKKGMIIGSAMLNMGVKRFWHLHCNTAFMTDWEII